MKSVLIIGLGRFGQQFAKKLYEQGNEVMAIDEDEELINSAMPYLTNAQIGDATNEQLIASLGVRNFDLCVVAIGENFESSLQTTALLKDYGAPFVLARAKSDVHEKFLLRNGADRVVCTERDMAERLAMKYGLDTVFDYIQLTDSYSIYEIQTPPKWVGKSIEELRVRAKYGISILATKKAGVMSPNPYADHVFSKDETLLIMGQPSDVRKLV
ncbi:MAG: TrkA family potassium uptake protein [Eubacteriales bacterium]|nr:TrkA family potassium uptake protein [Clostridiales bacterium]MDY3071955.1 TrkA family potassium uptake protein [Eubacteriales bacterium]MDY3286728.1 TrkA family potassium uptake protein [Eubacteriales bacterium]MDY5014833.1 TrkA family potassium uptake protein [Eubacteriales bacterium]